jgi:hypothetical protein
VIDRRDAAELRQGLLSINPDVSHRATEPPTPAEIYTPTHHISALDPDNTLVVGIRGVGKSFWAAALGDQAARDVAATAYPKLSLDRYVVAYGFTGFEGSEAPSPETLQQHGQNPESAKLFWRIVILRAFARASDISMPTTYREMMTTFSDSENREAAMRAADLSLEKRNTRLLLIFDALDTLSTDWPRLRMLTKALLEVTYAMRTYRALRLKLFLRPEQLDDPAVGFTDLSKLKAGKIDLSWDDVDLYGLFFTRLANETASRAPFARVVARERITLVNGDRTRLPTSLARDKKVQERVFVQLAGPYMGSDHRKGKTYTWLPAHLADGFKMTTPRSFLTALRRAAEVSDSAQNRVFTIEGIKDGLRAASRVRVDQLKEEYKWIELGLIPLAGLRVPCVESEIIDRWLKTRTTDAIEREAAEKGYLGPSEVPTLGQAERPKRTAAAIRERGLLATLLKIGVLERRPDSRINMPDIFRIGADIIGRGRVAPEG